MNCLGGFDRRCGFKSYNKEITTKKAGSITAKREL